MKQEVKVIVVFKYKDNTTGTKTTNSLLFTIKEEHINSFTETTKLHDGKKFSNEPVNSYNINLPGNYLITEHIKKIFFENKTDYKELTITDILELPVDTLKILRNLVNQSKKVQIDSLIDLEEDDYLALLEYVKFYEVGGNNTDDLTFLGFYHIRSIISFNNNFPGRSEVAPCPISPTESILSVFKNLGELTKADENKLISTYLLDKERLICLQNNLEQTYLNLI